MSIRKACPFFSLLFIAALFLSVPADSQADTKPFAPESIDGVFVVTAEEAIDLILSDPGMPIIDSRKKTEYVKGHIEGAINIANIEMTLDTLQQVAPEMDHAILFYCNGVRCLRSADAIHKAKSWGYTNMVWLRGGWQEWNDKHLPVLAD